MIFILLETVISAAAFGVIYFHPAITVLPTHAAVCGCQERRREGRRNGGCRCDWQTLAVRLPLMFSITQSPLPSPFSPDCPPLLPCAFAGWKTYVFGGMDAAGVAWTIAAYGG